MPTQDLTNSPKVLGLDISTKTIGWSLFDVQTQKLLELTHISPVIKPQPEDKIEELLMKVNSVEERLKEYKNFGITKVVIEEPIYDILGVVPSYISTYNARKFAWPGLVQDNGKGKKVLFGGLPKDADKKEIIWQLVSGAEPQIVWQYTRNNTLKKENFDQADAYTCVMGFMKQEALW